MEIITQFLAGETFNYFISHWRLESMIAIIVFILTYSFMKKKNNEYKKLNEKIIKRYGENRRIYNRDIQNFKRNGS